MAEEHKQLVQRWILAGHALLLLAIPVHLYMLWQIRVERSTDAGVSFFTPGFTLVASASLALIVITGLFMLSGKLPALLNPARFWIWSGLSLVGLVIANFVISSLSIYVTPFFVWLFLVDAGLAILAYREALAGMNTKTIIQNLFAIAFGIAFTLLMLEGLLRFYFNTLGTEAQRVAYVYSIEEILEAVNRYEGRPYVNYGLTTNHPEHNSRGYRGEEFSIPKDEGVFRIFALGGSTTYGEGVSPEESYPAQLERILHEDYGYTNVEVVNAGVNAYASFDSLANLTYHVLDDEPDMLIVYHGVNDVRARLVAPQYYSGGNIQRGYWNPRVLEQSLSPSVLLRFASVQTGASLNANQFENMLGAGNDIPRCGFFETTCTTVDNRPAEDILAENPPIYFERNLINMSAIASANDVDMLFATWLYYGDETELPNPMIQAHMQNAVDEQNAMIRATGESLNVPVIDFATTTTLDSAELWQDGMHVTADGARLQAEFFAQYLVENDLIPRADD